MELRWSVWAVNNWISKRRNFKRCSSIETNECIEKKRIKKKNQASIFTDQKWKVKEVKWFQFLDYNSLAPKFTKYVNCNTSLGETVVLHDENFLKNLIYSTFSANDEFITMIIVVIVNYLGSNDFIYRSWSIKSREQLKIIAQRTMCSSKFILFISYILSTSIAVSAIQCKENSSICMSPIISHSEGRIAIFMTHDW